MIDELADHLREHARDHYERVEARHVEACVEGIAASRQPLPDSLPVEALERHYQEWLAERHGVSTHRHTSRAETDPCE